MQGSPPQQPPAAGGAPVKPSSLDDAIFRFWTEFVGKQVAGGRRDVGRMLEVALGFFFERSLQGTKIDLDKRAAVENFIRTLDGEIARGTAVLDKLDPDAAPETVLPEPYQGVQVFFRDTDLANATQVTPLPARTGTRGHLGDYLGGLKKQHAAAERLKQLLTDKLVANRRMVSQRLKDLSPQLYELGVRMVSQAPQISQQPIATDDASLMMMPPAADLMSMPRTPTLQLIRDMAAGWFKERITEVTGGLAQIGPSLASAVPSLVRGTVTGLIGVGIGLGRGVVNTGKAFAEGSRALMEESRLAMEQARWEAMQRAAAAKADAAMPVVAPPRQLESRQVDYTNVPVEQDERFREYAELAKRWMQQSKQ